MIPTTLPRLFFFRQVTEQLYYFSLHSILANVPTIFYSKSTLALIDHEGLTESQHRKSKHIHVQQLTLETNVVLISSVNCISMSPVDAYCVLKLVASRTPDPTIVH